MKTDQTAKPSLTVSQGIKGALAIFLLATALGCQRVKFRNEQAPALESTPGDAERLLAQIKQLEESHKDIAESVASIKTDQLTIGTKVAGAQRQLAHQVAENAKLVQQEQVKLKTSIQDIKTQFTPQFQDLTGGQQKLDRVIETIQGDGQTLCKSHEQVLTELAELKQGYQHWQGELRNIQEEITALHSSVTAMQAKLEESKSAWAHDIKELAQDLSAKQGVEQDIGQQLSTLRGLVTEVEALQGRLLAVLKPDEKTAKTQDSPPIRVIELEPEEDGRLSLSRQIDAPTKAGIDRFRRP